MLDELITLSALAVIRPSPGLSAFYVVYIDVRRIILASLKEKETALGFWYVYRLVSWKNANLPVIDITTKSLSRVSRLKLEKYTETSIVLTFSNYAVFM